MARTAVKQATGTLMPTFSEAMESANLIGGGRLNSSELTLDGVGVDSTTDGTWVDLGVTADHSGLLVEGHIRLEINADFMRGGLDQDNTIIEAVRFAELTAFFIDRDSGANRGNAVMDSTAQIDSQLRLTAAPATYQHSNLAVTWQGKGSWVPFVKQWTSAGKFQTIVDGLAVAETDIGTYDWGGLDMDPYAVRDPGGATDSLLLRDVALLDAATEYGTDRLTVGLLGDSLMNFGGFPDWMWSDRPDQTPEWMPIVNSFATDGPKGIDGSQGAAAESTNGKHYDAGALTTIFREMHKQGYYTANNLNFTKGGATTEVIAENLDDMLTIDVPDVIFMNAGTNDANDGASFDATAQAAFDINLKAMMTTAAEAGVNQVVISNLHTLSNNSSFTAQVYADNVDICNSYISALPAWAEAQGYGLDFVRVADNFTAFGGHTPDTTLHITDDVHHQTKGSYTFGKTMGLAFTSRAAGARVPAATRTA